MTEFTKNLDDLLYLSKKHNLTGHLKKNYKENYHYITQKNNIIKKHGGHNKIIFMLTESTYELFKNSFNLRNRYIVEISDNIKQINIGMCIENQTIGFIENTYKEIIECKRQFYIGKYRADLYLPKYKLVIECDENNHIDRDIIKEQLRENYIISTGNKIIRYNPNENNFDLSNILREINKIIMI